MKKTFKADSRSSFQPGNGFCRCHLLLFLSKGRTIGILLLWTQTSFLCIPSQKDSFPFLTRALLAFSIFYSLILLIILCLTQARYVHFNYSRCKNSLKANSGMYCIFNLVKKLLIQGMQWLCPPALCCYRKITIPQLCALPLIQGR